MTNQNHFDATPIPEHLRPFIVEQDANLYTPIDHASWRFIMRISRAFFREHAHRKYLDGLRETGISTDRIPHISEMDKCLSRFGWRAVAVSGFIPPAAFMEFQSLGILPIACDMRQIDHIAYTPAPDIVHEAAGHAPIIADPDYAQYLRNYGQVARRAIFTDHDQAIYECVRRLSEIKEDPTSSASEIAEVQKQLDNAVAQNTVQSEAALLARMNWWTVEYGLIGTLENPVIYGAGLLSSVGESYKCLGPEVKKIPLTVECVGTSYDITKPQPQLFVTPNFEHLTTVLREFEATMAFKVGGVQALQKALDAKAVTTTVLDSGLQISGRLKEYLKDGQGGVAYLSYEGPTQLSYGDTELDGQDAKYHKSGFGTAVGAVAGMGAKKISEMTQGDFEKLGFKNDRAGTLKFTSGVTVTGRLKQIQMLFEKTLIVAFDQCTVKLGDRVLFDPAWGTFDLACGTEVRSVFGGAADRIRYLQATGGLKQSSQKQKTNLTTANKKLNDIYRRVAEIRASKSDAQSLSPALAKIFEDVSVQFPEDWLLSMELLELAGTHDLTDPWVARCKKHLDDFAQRSDEMKNLIDRGLFLIQI